MKFSITMQLEEIIQQAEEAAKRRAAQAAYELSEGTMNGTLQRIVFEICFSSVQLGARIMQEEMTNLINKEDESFN